MKLRHKIKIKTLEISFIPRCRTKNEFLKIIIESKKKLVGWSANWLR